MLIRKTRALTCTRVRKLLNELYLGADHFIYMNVKQMMQQLDTESVIRKLDQPLKFIYENVIKCSLFYFSFLLPPILSLSLPLHLSYSFLLSFFPSLSYFHTGLFYFFNLGHFCDNVHILHNSVTDL